MVVTYTWILGDLLVTGYQGELKEINSFMSSTLTPHQRLDQILGLFSERYNSFKHYFLRETFISNYPKLWSHSLKSVSRNKRDRLSYLPQIMELKSKFGKKCENKPAWLDWSFPMNATAGFKSYK